MTFSFYSSVDIKTNIFYTVKNRTHNIMQKFYRFLLEYNSNYLVESLFKIHLLIDELSDELKLKVLKELLILFNDDTLHLSELKTVLVVSKPFKNNKEIKSVRRDLLNTYLIKKG